MQSGFRSGGQAHTERSAGCDFRRRRHQRLPRRLTTPRSAVNPSYIQFETLNSTPLGRCLSRGECTRACTWARVPCRAAPSHPLARSLVNYNTALLTHTFHGQTRIASVFFFFVFFRPIRKKDRTLSDPIISCDGMLLYQYVYLDAC